MKKKFIALLSITALSAQLLTGCGNKAETSKDTGKTTEAVASTSVAATEKASSNKDLKVIKIGADITPHTEILKFVEPLLEKKGVKLEITTTDQGTVLNEEVANGDLEANYFQHLPYLESVNKEKGYNLVSAGAIHVEPIGLYSDKYQSIDKLPDGAKIAIPDNASNEYRALKIFEDNGLIKLSKDHANYEATPDDITDNPHKYTFQEISGDELVRTLKDVDAAVINTNFVLDAGIKTDSALIRESSHSDYGNIIAVKKGNENNPEIKTLIQTLQSPEVAKFIKDTYGTAVIPAWQ
jgi:D-methionine transport system substrate-binding protein